MESNDFLNLHGKLLENPSELIENDDPKVKEENNAKEESVAIAKSPTKTKKNKKKEKSDKKPITEEDLTKLVHQKLNEIKASESKPENEEKKKISHIL